MDTATLYLKISSLLAGEITSLDVALGKVLTEIRALRRFERFAITVMVAEDKPKRFEVSESPISGPAAHAEFRRDEVVVRVEAAPADLPLLGFVSQQMGLLVIRDRLSAANRALRAQLGEAEQALTLRKLLERARSLLVTHRGLTAASAHKALVEASLRHNKSLLMVVQEVVTVFGNPLLASGFAGRLTPGQPPCPRNEAAA